MITRLALAAAISMAVMALMTVRSALIEKGATTERDRVEVKGKATDAKAKTARKKAEAAPHEALARYCRDCAGK